MQVLQYNDYLARNYSTIILQQSFSSVLFYLFFFFNQQGFTNISSCVLGRDTSPTETLQIKAEYVAG